jgi:hypothetical protein
VLLERRLGVEKPQQSENAFFIFRQKRSDDLARVVDFDLGLGSITATFCAVDLPSC